MVCVKVPDHTQIILGLPARRTTIAPKQTPPIDRSAASCMLEFEIADRTSSRYETQSGGGGLKQDFHLLEGVTRCSVSRCPTRLIRRTGSQGALEMSECQCALADVPYTMRRLAMLIQLMQPRGSGGMIAGDNPLIGFESPSGESIARPIIPKSCRDKVFGRHRHQRVAWQCNTDECLLREGEAGSVPTSGDQALISGGATSSVPADASDGCLTVEAARVCLSSEPPFVSHLLTRTSCRTGFGFPIIGVRRINPYS
jgi:hypothetical protein